MDRLETLVEVHGGDGALDPEGYIAFRDADLCHAACSFASMGHVQAVQVGCLIPFHAPFGGPFSVACNIRMLLPPWQVLLARHPQSLATHQLTILDSFPETLDPQLYKALLPRPGVALPAAASVREVWRSLEATQRCWYCWDVRAGGSRGGSELLGRWQVLRDQQIAVSITPGESPPAAGARQASDPAQGAYEPNETVCKRGECPCSGRYPAFPQRCPSRTPRQLNNPARRVTGRIEKTSSRRRMLRGLMTAAASGAG